MNIIQIGANRGNDDVSELINNQQPTKLILVEPMKLHNEALNNFYHWVNNKFIENVVIDIEGGKDVEFFYHENDAPNYEISSLNKEHFLKHSHIGSPNFPSFHEGIKSFFIKSININDLFRKYELNHIDILFIDAEGHDDEIIKSIEFDNFKIGKLYFENLHIKDDNIYNYLEGKGYKITRQVGHNGWSSLAEFDLKF
jgi:FkbM family methyltransferase